jgi:glutamine synthetase
MTIVEYVWINNNLLHSKVKIVDGEHHSIHNIPVWSFNGTPLKQATSNKSEIILRPVSLYKNPFYEENSLIILCDTYVYDHNYILFNHPNNTRYICEESYKQDFGDPLIGFEQEYTILNDIKSKLPHYSTIENTGFSQKHFQYCLKAGLKMYGFNAESGKNQWEYQIGPCNPLEACDQLWISRFILYKLANINNLSISLDSYIESKNNQDIGKSIVNSCHTNISTIHTRIPNGIENIYKYIDNFSKDHEEYIKVCGENTLKRLTGDNDTSPYISFSYGIGTRDTSIRIPVDTAIKKCGYFEDRRPSANIDPYIILTYISKYLNI